MSDIVSRITQILRAAQDDNQAPPSTILITQEQYDELLEWSRGENWLDPDAVYRGRLGTGALDTRLLVLDGDTVDLR